MSSSLRLAMVLLPGTFFFLCTAFAGYDPGPSEPLQAPYHSEHEWIISTVCRNIFELLSYAKDKKGEVLRPDRVVLEEVPGDVLVYKVSVHGARVSAEATLRWPGPTSVWDVSAYMPFCQAVAQALNLSPPPPQAGQGDPIHALLEFSESAIQAENLRVSKWLSAEPDNAAAQEQAAFVLGTLALKEASGHFWDTRNECSHACAHLVVAGFLRGGTPTSVEGRLAACLIGMLANTKVQNKKDLDALGSGKNISPDMASWLNALRLRNTADWRDPKSAGGLSSLEQVEYFFALANSIGISQAILWLQTNAISDRPDWERMVLEDSYSVEAGHQYATPSINEELACMQGTFPGEFTGARLVSDLNEAPGDVLCATGTGAPALTIISRGMWAQFFQRHLCQAISQTGEFLANKYGDPEAVKHLDSDIGATWSGLSLYPSLQVENWTIRNTPVDAKAVLASFCARPELGDWYLRSKKVSPDLTGEKLQSTAFRWYWPPFLWGTAYAAGSRLNDGFGMMPNFIYQLFGIAPWHMKVAEAELAVWTKGDYTMAQARTALGPLPEYNLHAMDLASGARDISFDERIRLLQKSAAINPDKYDVLAKALLDAGRQADAAAAYQQYFDKGIDRVCVANGMNWLVNYYYDHGQSDRAMAIAKDCADVYSSFGLQTMMHLLEKMGRLNEAEQYGLNIQERYDESAPLAAFYMRHDGPGNEIFKTRLDSLISKIFPEGLNKVTGKSFKEAPTAGIRFLKTSDVMHDNGLSASQIIVALDGYGIQNKKQFEFVWRLSDAPVMKLIVWNGRAYQEITAKIPDRYFRSENEDYHR